MLIASEEEQGMFKFLYLSSFALVLAACGTHPGFSTIGLSFSDPESFSTLQNKFGSARLGITSDIISEINKPLVKSGKLFAGNRIFSPGVLATNSYTWYIDSPCTQLPQGNNVVIRYELYDSVGEVVQKDSIEVAKITTC